MSIMDAKLEFSDAQAQAASSAAVTQSTNVVNFGTGRKNAWGTADYEELGGMVWNVKVGTAVNASTVITAQLMAHTAASSIKSGTQIAQIALPAAAAAGTLRSLKFTPGTTIGKQYLGVTYTVSGAKCTAGAIDSWLGHDNEVY